MAVLQEYKCPCCGGAIVFDSASQNMQCPYCDTEFQVSDLEAFQKELNSETADDLSWQTEAGSQWQPGEAEALRQYVCNSCGGEIVADANTAATACPYCGNPVVMVHQVSGILRPDYVIPFKLDKNAAKEALRRHYSGKPLLPKLFQEENHIDEVKGVYVPVWLFDADAQADVRYRGTKVHSWSDSDYIYTRTSYFAIRRSGQLGFSRVPVDGSTKMADDLMESIEPFDFSEAVDFHTAYLSGYLADKYDVDAQQSIERANDRIKNSAVSAIAATVQGYATLIPEATAVQLQNGQAKYALYPVWMLSTTWQGKQYLFAMNGQTGKLVGDLPVDQSAYKKWLFGLAGAISAAAFALSYLVWLL